MQNFLSNIGVGVFSLQDVIEDGLDAVIPQGLQNQAKKQRKQLDDINKQQRRLQSLLRSGNLSQEKQTLVEKRISKLKESYWTERKEALKKQIDRQVANQSISGKLKNFGTTWGGRATAGIGSAVTRSIQKTFSNISQQVGETGFLSDRLLEDFDRIASASRETVMSGEKLFNTVDDNFDTFLGLRREFGHIENYSLKALDNITQLEDVIGLSSEEATDLLSTFKGINRESIQTNTTMIQTFSLLANEEGVAFRDVMQDITDNAEFFATYMSDSSENIDNLIIKAQKLGTSFSDFTQVFESFSDIESTIEKQARMSIFANRRFDFLSVLEQLQNEEVGKAQSNIMNQLGGIDEGTFDNPFIKKQLAEGFGVDSQTLNKLFKASNNELSDREVVDREFSDELAKFNENFKQLGFGTLRKYFTQYFLTPLNQLFKQNSGQLQDIFEGIGGIIKTLGKATTWFAKKGTELHGLLSKFIGKTNATFLELTGAVGTLVTVGKGLSALNNYFSVETYYLKKIDAKLGLIAGQSVGGSGGMMSGAMGYGIGLQRKGGKVRKGLGKGIYGGAKFLSKHGGKVLGAGAGLAMGGMTGYNQEAEGIDPWKLGGSIGTGALQGFLMSGFNPWGAVAGGVAGGVGYGAGRYMGGSGESKPDSTTVNQNRGGIFTKRYTGKMDVAETGKPEGFVPLETQDGKPTMPADLSDRTIKKLAGAMSKMKFEGRVNVDGKKQKIEFYNHAMNPSSALNV